jgi:hypothetical protein
MPSGHWAVVCVPDLRGGRVLLIIRWPGKDQGLITGHVNQIRFHIIYKKC